MTVVFDHCSLLDTDIVRWRSQVLDEVEALVERRVCDAASPDALDEVVDSLVRDTDRPPLRTIINFHSPYTHPRFTLLDA